jgi:dTDP-glucose 4,6-dehydratase
LKPLGKVQTRPRIADLRVLLTGASGFLGSHCLRHLLVNTDWQVVCPVSFKHKGLPERIVVAVDQEEWWDRVEIVRCDLACPINDTTAYLFGQVDYVINYASESHVDRSIDNPVSFIQNNIDVVLNVLEYARKVRPKVFVQVSTDEVYGPAPDGYACAEWDPIIPSNPYSASKAAQEAIAISYWRTYGINLIITNCMNLIGETQDPEKFVPMIISHALHGETVPIHASSTGVIGSRFYLHARNLADAILFLIQRGNVSAYSDSVGMPDRWNIVGEREVSNLEMAQMVADCLGEPLQYELVDFHTSRPGHDLRYALDGTKLAATGWTMPVPLDASIKALVNWTRAHPEWASRRPD